jgi:hypothetical protein
LLWQGEIREPFRGLRTLFGISWVYERRVASQEKQITRYGVPSLVKIEKIKQQILQYGMCSVKK